MEKRIAAFIMTYERPDLISTTIQKLFEQSLPPEKVLIVDNSDSEKVQEKVQGLDPRVFYHRVGHNSGPAGASKIGLQTLAQEGFKWIFWGDDDDPPPTNDCFEKLIGLAESYKGNCGQIGLVGHKLNKFTGLLKRTPDEVLYKSEYVEVDTIGGGMCKIVNAQAVLDGVLPEEKLFFGLEELDFDLTMKNAGYNIIVHSGLFLACRIRSGKLNYKHVYGKKRSIKLLYRHYYSVRNNLFVMLKNRYYIAFISSLLLVIIKSFFSFRHGLQYGSIYTKHTYKALWDFGMVRFYKKND